MNSQTLLNEIKNFSTPEFKDLKIFSRPYFKNIIMKLYENPKQCDNNFVFIYGDFNMLNDYNHKYGFEAGNNAIYNSLKVIREIFPNNSYISRVSGDEFTIIIENIDEATAKEYCSKINSILKTRNDCLDLAFGITSSTEFNDIKDMFIQSEKRQGLEKLSSIDNGNYHKVLDLKMKHNFRKFFNNFRFSNYFEFTPDHVKILASNAFNSAITLLEDSEYLQQTLNKINASDSVLDFQNSLFDYNFSKNINDYINFENTNLTAELYNNTYKLNQLLDTLIRNPVSGFFNKNYFYNYFLPQYGSKSFSCAALVDTSGIKDCNTKFSHIKTDEKLHTLSTNLLKNFTKIGTNFNDKKFDISDNENYVFDLGGGNFFFVINNIPTKSISNIVNLPDSIQDSISPLKTISSYCDGNNKTLSTCIQMLKNDCNFKKSNLKQSDLNSDEAYRSLEIFISDCVQYYLDNSHAPKDLKNQREFLSSMMNIILEQAHKSAKEFTDLKQIEK